MAKSISCFNFAFQFQYGSIKRPDTLTKVETETLFQFQYGSIKSRLPSGLDFGLSPFQFQYGSIKSLEILQAQ